jgi:hypothetical protein
MTFLDSPRPFPSPPFPCPHSTSLLHFQLQIPILENRTRLSWQQRALGRRVLCFPGVADGLHGDPFDAFELVDVLDVSI